MDRQLFGTDGVRGLAGTYPLDDKGCTQIAKAVGSSFAAPGETVVIGHDTRESSSRIVHCVIDGLISVGVNVVNIGVIPTPGLAYITKVGDFSAGIMITASHNTYEYNGIKVFSGSGDKLSDEEEAKLNTLINSEIQDKEPAKARNDHSLVEKYKDFLIESAPGLDLSEYSIGIDTANGATSGIAEDVFKRLGADVSPIFDKPNGRNINDKCGATHPEALANRLLTNKLSLGIALDGDGDRLIMIDSLGREVKGDYIMYILAVVKGLKGVVATSMSNLGFEKALKEHGIELVRTDVGDRYVLEALEETGLELGGEQSGHIIMPNILKTGDGILAAIHLIKAVKESGKNLAEWCDEITPFPQALVNIRVEDKSVLEDPEIKKFIVSQTESLGDNGRVLIRPSGTEPLARV
ncbi:MAG: phosphoglucosamine mutase, partial [Candidatus Saccharimonadales bacterium]